MQVRSATAADTGAIAALHRDAFGPWEGDVIADLVAKLLTDKSALPLLSLLAEEEGRVVGHALFSRVEPGAKNPGVAARILSPLGVASRHQRRGIGEALVRTGLTRLQNDRVGLIFVLGNPDYYSRFGFVAATGLGLDPPHPLPEDWRDAWMVLFMDAGLKDRISTGTVLCSRVLGQAHYWQE
ncbi:MAG: N-acetyltransferase [Gammaproteobacteria bacterium]|nr:N-acetyltransferase [Pseudomonadales bacterium]MCP5345604.1 N-acetyltransferase [Pseudomonadales bacterium]